MTGRCYFCTADECHECHSETCTCCGNRNVEHQKAVDELEARIIASIRSKP